MKNEKGYVMGTALLLLMITTLIGIAAITSTNLERHTSTNFLLYEKNFYAADSGIEVAPLFASKNQPVADYTNANWSITTSRIIGNSRYNAVIKNAVDSDGKVILYGDKNGDFLWEFNSVEGRPVLNMVSVGEMNNGITGFSKIEAKFCPLPLFPMPKAALTVHSEVHGHGVSGNIVGEGPHDPSLIGKSYYDTTYNLSPVADIAYQTALSTIDYSGNTGANKLYKTSGGLYPFSLISNNLMKHSEIITTLPGNKFPSGTNLTNSIVYIDAGPSVKISQNIEGSGILVINGSVEIAGNFHWVGLVLCNGNLTMNGGGASNSTMVRGAIVAIGNAIALNGAVDIIYDGNVLNKLYNDNMTYSVMSWKEVW